MDAPVRGGRFLIGWNLPNSHSFFKIQSLAAVLVAIAIPVFTTQLERSREATDLANIRAAYAEAMTDYIADGKTVSKEPLNKSHMLSKALSPGIF